MAKNRNDDPVFLTVAEVARRWRMSPISVYKMIWAGRLPSVRVSPRAVRVRFADVLVHEGGNG